MKLRNPLGFSYIKNMLKDQLFKTNELQLYNWLFGPEKFSELSRNRPLDSHSQSFAKAPPAKRNTVGPGSKNG